MKEKMKRIALAWFFGAMGISFGTYATEALSGAPEKQIETPDNNYVPGMGEIMGATQMRHSKLWFAGNAHNWDLASYELEEIKEGLADAAKYHPVFKKDAPVAAIIDKFMAQPLKDIESAVKAKDSKKFRKSFDTLTRACNACHHAASQEFIAIKRPGIPPFSNQEFAVKPK